MTARKAFWYGLTAASFAFLGGVASGALTTSTALSCRIVSQAEDYRRMGCTGQGATMKEAWDDMWNLYFEAVRPARPQTFHSPRVRCG